jgi:hypothetical protein
MTALYAEEESGFLLTILVAQRPQRRSVTSRQESEFGIVSQRSPVSVEAITPPGAFRIPPANLLSEH